MRNIFIFFYCSINNLSYKIVFFFIFFVNEDGKIGDKLSLNGPQAEKFTCTLYLLTCYANEEEEKTCPSLI